MHKRAYNQGYNGETTDREWMEKKKKTEFKQYMKEMTMKADDNETAPWVPP